LIPTISHRERNKFHRPREADLKYVRVSLSPGGKIPEI